ncbi:MAG TPA: MmgE/PrpD family protein [Aliidongia sp.]|uniref:MmgE/PrpD family protein n=1 Tax=Aliidongia sp. TaxID=1914230 RepID=UPI002DDD6DED|nr:MmgE/PrpD family protein [Aliidongia sp.]HEV2673052.1 MmgE/PrpD family protein [Aliidongia sp.]
MAQALGLTRKLSQFIAHAQWEDIPQTVRHQARRALLNFFATAISGSMEPAIDLALVSLREFGLSTQATIIGRRDRIDGLSASFLNAASANIADFDDTHIPTVIHPSAPIFPVLFALAERGQVDGKDLLLAFIVGVEIACRLGNAIYPEHYRRGWHITATCGILGATAAASRALGLNERAIIWALGNAATQSSGLVESLGTMAKSVSIGNAARNGLWSALLAQRGFSGPDLPIEGANGFLAVMASNPDLSGLTKAFGGRWELSRNTYKPYPCGVVINPVIDACLAWRDQDGVDPAALSEIVVFGNPLLLQRADRADIQSSRESQVSAQHAIAVSLLFGTPGLQAFSDEAVFDASVALLRRKVRLIAEDTVPVEAARIIFRCRDGSARTVVITKARGSLDHPLSDTELEDKFHRLTSARLDREAREALCARVWSAESLPDVRELLTLSVPAR